jgi:threonine dehydratase/serine racemase
VSRYAADLEDVRAAARRIAPHAHRTPVVTCTTLDVLAERQLYFKCEHLQKAGAFKFRGAYNAVSQLSEVVAARGVATHSSGNHAQALALAARLHGIAAHVVVPRGAPRTKLAATLGYGARVIECAPTLEARESTLADVVRETGAALVHPYDHPSVIAGQGTVALELLEEVPDLDALVAPVGGGGLVAGTCVAAHGLRPGLRVFAAEPAGADDAARSKAAGRLIPQTDPHTLADGLLTSLGELTWPILRDQTERVLTVGEEATVESMRLLWERAKLPVEPSAAVALAAVLDDEFRALHGIERVGVILSGGNVDVDRLPWLPSAAG